MIVTIGRINCFTKPRLMAEARFAELGLPAKVLDQHAVELSGGQMQRLMIARIFLLKPKILLADEPTSMVDACSRATAGGMLFRKKYPEKMMKYPGSTCNYFGNMVE